MLARVSTTKPKNTRKYEQGECDCIASTKCVSTTSDKCYLIFIFLRNNVNNTTNAITNIETTIIIITEIVFKGSAFMIYELNSN